MKDKKDNGVQRNQWNATLCFFCVCFSIIVPVGVVLSNVDI